MKPRSWGIVLSLLAVLVLLFSAEVLYRRRVLSQLAAIKESLVATHPDWKTFDPEFRRFDRESADCDASLIADVSIWVARTLGFGEGPNQGDIISHSYILATFLSWPESDKEAHEFLWSPIRLRFVHWNDQSRCRAPACPWRESKQLRN